MHRTSGRLSRRRSAPSATSCGIVMIVDEIFTGFGRTGAWFAIDRDGYRSRHSLHRQGDGLGRSDQRRNRPIATSWRRGRVSTGEALHTSTYLGNPLGCAAALATIDELERLQLPARAARLGARLGPRLDALRVAPRRRRRPRLRIAVGRATPRCCDRLRGRQRRARARRHLPPIGSTTVTRSTISPPLIIDENAARSRDRSFSKHAIVESE